jgi:hypothetical protein
MPDYGGMTVNERLVISGQMKAWDAAVAVANRTRMIAILVATEMTERQAQETVAAVLADPARYGYPVRS